jgi:hypothetical protein
MQEALPELGDPGRLRTWREVMVRSNRIMDQFKAAKQFLTAGRQRIWIPGIK